MTQEIEEALTKVWKTGKRVLVINVPTKEYINARAKRANGEFADVYIGGSHNTNNSFYLYTWMPSTKRDYWRREGYEVTAYIEYYTLISSIKLGGE